MAIVRSPAFAYRKPPARRIGKPAGSYITAELPPFSDNVHNNDQYISLLGDELRLLLPHGPVLVAGLGNRDITPDALGPKAADRVLATRHIRGELSRVAGMENLRDVSVLIPGVLGNTGIETAEAPGNYGQPFKTCLCYCHRCSRRTQPTPPGKYGPALRRRDRAGVWDRQYAPLRQPGDTRRPGDRRRRPDRHQRRNLCRRPVRRR